MRRVPQLMRRTASEKVTRAAADVAAQIRRSLKVGGSADHAAGVQWFFKEEIKSHGWYTADLRRLARRFRREIRDELGLDFLVNVADQLFSGRVLDEKIVAIFLLEKLDAEFGDREFALLRGGWTASAVGQITTGWCMT